MTTSAATACSHTTLDDPRGRVSSTGFHYDFLANSFSKDGKRFTLVFTGSGNADALNLVDGSFTVRAGGGSGGSGDGSGGSGNGSNGSGNGSNGPSNSGSGTGCDTTTTSSSGTVQSSGSGGSAGDGSGSDGTTGTTSTSTDTGAGSTTTGTDCSGTGTDTSGDTFTTFGGGGSTGSTSGQTTGQQGTQATQPSSQGSGSVSFSLDPGSFRRDTDTPPEGSGCDASGMRLLTPRADRAGGTREVKGKGDAGQVVAGAAPEEACGQRKDRPPDPADAQAPPPALYGQM